MIAGFSEVQQNYRTTWCNLVRMGDEMYQNENVSVEAWLSHGLPAGLPGVSPERKAPIMLYLVRKQI